MAKSYRVLPEWFMRKDNANCTISSWCKKKSSTEVLCLVCDKEIYCERKGFAALTQHAKSLSHSNNYKLKHSSDQLVLKPRESGVSRVSEIGSKETAAVPQIIPSDDSSTCNQNIMLFHPKEPTAIAELTWVMKSVVSNIAPAVCDDLKDVFSAMFPNAVPQDFSLGRTKISYLITEALGPYFYSLLTEKAKDSHYSLLYDETTNHGNQKELQFALRFWSEEEKEIECHHLKTVFLGHATAEDIKREIFSVLNEANLSSKNLLMLGSDGPAVNQKVFRIMNTQLIEERGNGLLDIGVCNLHVIHNAFLKGINEFGDTAKELISDVYYFFKKYPSRWEDFKNVQEKLKLKNERFIKHTSTRWLTVGPAAERMISQWPAVVEYFLKFIPARAKSLEKTEKYKRIANSLKFIDIKLEIIFLTESAKIFEPFLLLFQRSEPLIHILYNEITNLLRKIAGRICKKESIDLHHAITSAQLLPIGKVYCGKDLTDESLALKESERKDLKHKIQQHYLAAFNYLIRKTSLDSGGRLLSYFQCLQPKEINKEKSLRYASEIARSLGFKEEEIRDEWLLLQYDPNTKKCVDQDSNLRIDHFWRNVIYEKNALGVFKYPKLASFVKACLSLSHGNSDVERGFSVSQRVLTAEKASMSEKMLNARLNIRDGVKKYKNVAAVPITKKLLSLSYSACRSYKAHLEEEKKLKEKQLKAAQMLEEEKKKAELLEQDLRTKKDSIINIETKSKAMIEKKKELQSSADALLKEANERLKEAIKEKDNVKIRIAQGILEAAEKTREQERDQEQSTDKINRIIHKRKTNLIDFLTKPPKKAKKD